VHQFDPAELVEAGDCVGQGELLCRTQTLEPARARNAGCEQARALLEVDPEARPVASGGQKLDPNAVGREMDRSGLDRPVSQRTALAQKRGELEMALLAAEENWLALSSQAEAAAG